MKHIIACNERDREKERERERKRERESERGREGLVLNKPDVGRNTTILHDRHSITYFV